MAVVEGHEGIRSGRRIECDKGLEFLEGLGDFPRRKIAFTERRVEIRAARANLDALFQKRDGIFKKGLPHAQARHQEDYVGVARSGLMRTGEKIESLFILPLV